MPDTAPQDQQKVYTVTVAVTIDVLGKTQGAACRRAEEIVARGMSAHECRVEWIGVEGDAKTTAHTSTRDPLDALHRAL